MESKVNYAAVGAFVIGIGLALVLAILWLAAGGEFKRRVTRYESLSNESVAGLNVNAPVKLRGVDVGKVKSIAINPANGEQVRIVYEIEVGTPIKTDTVATLTTQGLTGIAYVELSGGSKDAPWLVAPTEDDLPRIPTRPSLAVRLESVLSRVLASVEKTSASVNEVFSAENKESLRRTLADLSTLTHALAARKDAIDGAITDAGRTFHGTTQAGAQLAVALDKVGRGADAVNAAAEKVSKLGTSADRTITGMGQDVHKVATEALPQVENMMNELSGLAASLRRLSDQTADNPSVLLRGPGPVKKGPGE
jgi:phospholipid/cholesterol/gamma-HCH transport system substrate-binding protein